MLTINQTHIDAFKTAALKGFKSRMVNRVKELALTHFQYNGEEAARNLVEYGVKKATAHGFTEQDTIRLYLDFMVIYGCDFDVDPQLPWASRVLNSERDEDELIKSQRLYVLGRSYDQDVSGMDTEYSDEAMATLSNLPVQGFLTPGMSVKGQLYWIYPRKYEYLGEESIDLWLTRVTEIARHYGLETHFGIAGLAILMFLFGWGFCHDPQYPWARAILNDPAMNDDQRLETLCQKAQGYVSFVFSD